jgi:mono/diheme cytochrome c family protein
MALILYTCRAKTIRRAWWIVGAVLLAAFVPARADDPPPAAEQPADHAAIEPLDPEHAAKMARGLEIFNGQVRAILVNRCVQCHGGERIESEFDLTDRPALLKGGALGPAVVPGNAADSQIMQYVTHASEPHMPKDAERLPDEEIAQLAAWIDNLAPYDGPLVGDDERAAAWTTRVVAPDAREFWAYQPLMDVEAPEVRDPSWCRTAVDRFVLAQLETAGIEPSPEAERRALARRAYFDLTGLPPTPEELQTFLDDSSDNAYDRLLDRLLDSPHYGERWARHWLDLVRFAESHGFEHDYDRPTAYHYRDFVIEALNRDLPYDTFVKWQLAGDEYAPDDRLALMATGFLAAGVHSTQITANEAERHRYDELDDMLTTIGTSMLGLSFGCARCHDHKFDPIPQRDYYQMLSTFTTTVRSEVDLNFDPEGYASAKAAWDAEHAPLQEALAQFERDELPARLAAWEATGTGLPAQTWLLVDPVEATSAAGATFARQADGSLRAEGANGDSDTYTFVILSDSPGISHLRIEALADPALVAGGPGRADNGNFALSDVRLSAAPRTDAAQTTSIELRNPRATFEQANLPVAATIDADAHSAWAVDPEFGKDHAAAYEMAAPVTFEGGAILTLVLKFECNTRHNIGRIRLALAAGAAPELTAPAVPAAVPPALARPAAERTADEQTALLAWYRTQDERWQQLHAAVEQHQSSQPQPVLTKVLISSEGLPPVRLHSQGEDFLPETFFLRRGDPNQKAGPAGQSYLQVLMPAEESVPRWQPQPPPGWRTSHRRTAFAEWLTDVDAGAGGLLARVIVNRLWQHHLGRGLVATPSDFGTRGERPVDPMLLDYLARELIAGGWRLKPIHKLLMQSAVYRQADVLDESRRTADPEEKLFWRWRTRRLEAEAIRDSLLATSGLLDRTQFGPGTLEATSRRRSIYFTVKRSKLVPMMQVFDWPDALQGIPERPTTTIAPQALMLLNNPQVRECAKALADRVSAESAGDAAAAVRRGYLWTLSREPTTEELVESGAFVAAQEQTYAAAGRADSRPLALADFCQVLFCLNEFVYVD